MERRPDRRRIYGLAAREGLAALRGGAASALVRLRAVAGSGAKRLVIAPQDLRTADPTIATEIYHGHFIFAGRAVATGGRPPFEVRPPSQAWGEELYGFGWLRHLRAADTALARANARALVGDFLNRGGDRRIARATSVTARRLVAFLSQSPLILEGADHLFYRRFLQAIDRSVRGLERDLGGRLRPLDRLAATVALCYAGVCCEGFEPILRRATRALGRELDRQFLPDGGHLSRDPEILLELPLDLLPLRQAYLSRGREPPEGLVPTVDRALALLRLFRHGDGTLARFNGMGATPAGHLATLAMYQPAGGEPMRRAPDSGYERLSAGRTVLVADVGPSPPLPYSARAHAGCLSFELSSGSSRIVVNRGGSHAGGYLERASRATAAHSTAEIGDVSSCRFLSVHDRGVEGRLAAWMLGRLGPVALDGPREVEAERGDADDGPALRAAHDGYAPAFGIVHRRDWRLSADGGRLDGEDTFPGRGAAGAAPTVAVRFHLAPGVRAGIRDADGTIDLALSNGETWRFASDRPPSVEEAGPPGSSGAPRRAEQIVLRLGAEDPSGVRWSFERTG